MLTRRIFANCAICTAIGLVATGAEAQTGTAPAPTTGVQRTVLQQMDGPVEGWMTLIIRGEIPAGATVAGHTHPGIENAYILEGGGELTVQGKPPLPLKPGDTFQIAPNVPHGLQNGAAPLRFTSTYIVEKGKPLASPATV